MGFSTKTTGAGLIAVATVAAGALTLVPTAGAAPDSAGVRPGSARTVTDFGLKASAFGTRVLGGGIPANSGRTAFAYLGCTRVAGLDRTNHLVGADINGLDVRGVDSTAKTFTRNGDVHSKAVNTIARVQLGSGANAVMLKGITAVADTWHDSRGFHSRATTRIANIDAGTGVVGPSNPGPGDTLDVPGVATLTFLGNRRADNDSMARAKAQFVKVDLTLTDTTVVVGNAFAEIRSGFATGILGGVAHSADGKALQRTATTGNVAVQPLPCQGTDGKWITNKTAGVHVPDLIHLGAATASARGDQRSRTSGYAQTRGRVARVTVGADRGLVIKGVVGAANVTKNGGKLVKTAKGTRITSITFNGRDRAIPTAGDPLRIAGLAKLSAPKVDRSKYGISVVALRVELLQGSNTVVNLGVAKAQIRKR